MQRLHVAIGAGLAVAAWLVPTSRAEACGVQACIRGAFSPPDGASVPAERAVFYWRPPRPLSLDEEDPDPGQVHLRRSGENGEELALEVGEAGAGFTFSPSAPLEPGVAYRLSEDTGCDSSGEGGVEVTFTAAAAASDPEALGELKIEPRGVGELQVASGGGACRADVEADRVAVELELAPSAEPWRDLLHFETLVDGTSWRASSSATTTRDPGESWRGRARDELYTTCHADDEYADIGLDEGIYEVMMRATLPGTDLVLESGPAMVELDCSRADAAAGCSAAGGQGSTTVTFAGLLLLAAGRLRRKNGVAPC